MNDDEQEDRAILASAMQAIRKMRRMGSAEVARKMGVSLSTYERMEAGKGSYSFRKLLRFAQATNCDIAALTSALTVRNPLFAVFCANNRGMLIILYAIHDLFKDMGDDFKLLDRKWFFAVATRMTKDLKENFTKRDMFADIWLNERNSSLGYSSDDLGDPDPAI